MSGQLWSLATVIGPIALILVIGYALIRRLRLTDAEQRSQSAAVKDIYRGGEGGPYAPRDGAPPKPEKDG